MALKEGIPVTEFSMPSMLGGQSDPSKIYDKYSIKYLKAEVDDAAQIIMLQNIETRGLKGDEVVVLKKDTYVFMDRFFVILQYMEKNED